MNDTPRAWQRMLSGRRLNLLDPSPLDVEIDDIAHGLSKVARWNGQTSGKWAFSVAQHSSLVLDITMHLRPNLPAKWQLAALLHDAPEYVVGDLISPFKAAVGLNYKDLENRLLAAIHTRFGVPIDMPKTIKDLIKRADRASAHLEAVQLAGFTEQEARKYFGSIKGLENIVIKPLAPDQAKKMFLDAYNRLHDAL